MGAAVETGAAGEETVAVADLDNILIGAACGDDGSGAALFPHVDILLRVEGDDTFAGSAGSGLDADTILEICSEQAIRICFAQIVFGEEREFLNVIDTPDVFGLYTFLIHQVTVVGDIVVDIFNLFDNLLILDLENFFP